MLRFRGQFRGHHLCDVGNRAETASVHVLGLELDAVLAFEMRHELKGGKRIEDATRHERSVRPEMGRILTRKESLQNVRLNGALDVVHGRGEGADGSWNAARISWARRRRSGP